MNWINEIHPNQRRFTRMKRAILVALCIIVLCSLSPLALVNASYSGYATTNYSAITSPIEDGAWTTSDEWVDAAVPPNLPTTFQWREKWTQPSDIIEHFLIEFFTDNTNDTGDYYQICIDNTANGGSAPQTDDIRIDWVGHSFSGLHLYKGNGTGWAPYTSFAWGTDLFIAESLSSSPLNSTAHWIMELRMDRTKADFDVSQSTPAYSPWIRVAVYDANNSAAGVQAWPPTSRDVPNDWGLETGTIENIPESLTIAVVVVLSSVAAVAGFYLLRKHPKTEKHGTVRIDCTR
jgi:hypothetical protein